MKELSASVTGLSCDAGISVQELEETITIVEASPVTGTPGVQQEVFGGGIKAGTAPTPPGHPQRRAPLKGGPLAQPGVPMLWPSAREGGRAGRPGRGERAAGGLSWGEEEDARVRGRLGRAELYRRCCSHRHEASWKEVACPSTELGRLDETLPWVIYSGRRVLHSSVINQTLFESARQVRTCVWLMVKRCRSGLYLCSL